MFSLAEKNKLFTENQDWIVRNATLIAKHNYLSNYTDDMIQVAYETFFSAVERWNPEEQKLRTFIYHRIHGAIIDSSRDYKYSYRSSDGKRNYIKLTDVDEDHFPANENLFSKKLLTDIYSYVLNNFSERSQLVFRYYYIDGFSVGEIADKLDLTKRSIHTIKKEVIQSLKERYEN